MDQTLAVYQMNFDPIGTPTGGRNHHPRRDEGTTVLKDRTVSCWQAYNIRYSSGKLWLLPMPGFMERGTTARGLNYRVYTAASQLRGVCFNMSLIFSVLIRALGNPMIPSTSLLLRCWTTLGLAWFRIVDDETWVRREAPGVGG